MTRYFLMQKHHLLEAFSERDKAMEAYHEHEAGPRGKNPDIKLYVADELVCDICLWSPPVQDKCERCGGNCKHGRCWDSV